MRKYTVYDPDTGKILRTGQCQDIDFDAQAGNYQVAEGCYDDSIYYWDGQFIEKPEKTSEHHVFDYEAKAWALDEERAWESIRAKRNLLLLQSDWTQATDAPEEIKIAWQAYRQALRDITDQSLESLNWPNPPQE